MAIDSAIFLQEAAELLESLEADLLSMESEGPDADRIDSAFRALHTLKGSGGMFGFRALSRFVHDLENAFEIVRAGGAPADAALLQITLDACGHIERLVASGGDEEAETELEAMPEAAALRTAIAEWIEAANGAGDGTGKGPGAPDAPGEVADGAPATWDIHFVPETSALRNGTRPDLLVDDIATLGRGTVTVSTEQVPPLEDIDPAASYLSWRIELTTERPRSAIEEVFLFADPGEVTIELRPPADPPAEGGAAPVSGAEPHPTASATDGVGDGPPPTDPGGTTGERSAPGGNKRKPQQLQTSDSVRVQASRLDDLMDQLAELVIAQSRLDQIAATRADAALGGATEEIERLISGLRETTLSIRMLPIELVFGKFRRVVRDLSAELGKPVALVTSGGATEVDKNVIDSLTEPLVHIVRNAIDHGIEDADARRASGKQAEARLELTARQGAGEVLIGVRDDGRGLDLEAIRTRAVSRGLIAEDETPSEAELSALIFHPGFSTSVEVSSISGRGVGMDAVRRAVEDLRGSVEVSSEPGQGTTVTLRLPLTLAIIDGLMVQVAGSPYVLPLASVEECVELGDATAERASGRRLLRIRDDLVPVLDLAERFGLSRAKEVRPRVVVVGTESRRIGVIVDEIVGQHQTVVKSLSVYHRGIPGISGATILGNGAVALILDVGAMVKALLSSSEVAA